jgi:hypothetical protein
MVLLNCVAHLTRRQKELVCLPDVSELKILEEGRGIELLLTVLAQVN